MLGLGCETQQLYYARIYCPAFQRVKNRNRWGLADLWAVQWMKVAQLKWSGRGGMWLLDQAFQSQGVSRMSETWEMCDHRKKHVRAMGMGMLPCLGCLCGAGKGQLDLKATLHFQLRSKGVFNYLSVFSSGNSACDDISCADSSFNSASSNSRTFYCGKAS